MYDMTGTIEAAACIHLQQPEYVIRFFAAPIRRPGPHAQLHVESCGFREIGIDEKRRREGRAKCIDRPDVAGVLGPAVPAWNSLCVFDSNRKNVVLKIRLKPVNDP